MDTSIPQGGTPPPPPPPPPQQPLPPQPTPPVPPQQQQYTPPPPPPIQPQADPVQTQYAPPQAGQLTGQSQQFPQGQAPVYQQPVGQMTPPPPPPPPPPPKPSKPANFQLGALLPAHLKIKVPPHDLKFDEQYFLRLLAGSISLTRDEKTRIVESIPKLKQSQIDELIRIFEEERRKFAELGEEHVPQLEKLAKQHYEDWIDIETKQEQSGKAEEDAKKAEEIRKNLGL